MRRWYQFPFSYSIMVFVLVASANAMGEAYLVTCGGHVQPASALGQGSKQNLELEFVTPNITFIITYRDPDGAGFRDAAAGEERQGALEDALAYVADVLGETGELDVLVDQSTNSGQSLLAQGGTFFPGSPAGFYNGAAYDRLTTGSKPAFAAGLPDVFIKVDFGFNWNEDDGEPAAGEVDLRSVLVHEITHALGFVSLMDSTGVSLIPGPENTPSDVFTVWDSLLIEASSGMRLLLGSPPALVPPASSLTADDVAFDGSEALARYGQGSAPPVLAPSSFAPSQSLQHWKDSFLEGGLVGDAVMESTFLVGTNKREYRNIDIGALRDIGYTRVAGGVAPEGEASAEGDGGAGGGEGEAEGSGGEGEGDSGEGEPGAMPADCANGDGETKARQAGLGGDQLMLLMALACLWLAARKATKKEA